MMDLRNNPRAVAAARRIQAETGFDVLDDASVERALALCAAGRARARRWAVISGLLAAAVIAAWSVAGAFGQVHGYQWILGPALLLLNGFRMVKAVAAARKLGRISRSIETARAAVLAAAAGSPAPRGPAPPPPDVARWN